CSVTGTGGVHGIIAADTRLRNTEDLPTGRDGPGTGKGASVGVHRVIHGSFAAAGAARMDPAVRAGSRPTTARRRVHTETAALHACSVTETGRVQGITATGPRLRNTEDLP